MWKINPVLNIGDQSSQDWREISIEAVSKYPFISSSTESIRFGEVQTGRSSQKELTIKNSSSVGLFRNQISYIVGSDFIQSK